MQDHALIATLIALIISFIGIAIIAVLVVAYSESSDSVFAQIIRKIG